LTRLEDVVAARDLGVWALGFVFAPSPRRLEPGAARGLLEAAGLGRSFPGSASSARAGATHGAGAPLTVGVFTDADAGEIARVVGEVGLDAVQLHGIGGPSAGAVAAALGGRQRTVLIIRALPVDPGEGDPTGLRQAVAEAGAYADIVLLDTRVSVRARAASAGGTSAEAGGCAATSAPSGAGFGGSGTVFRWRLAREAAPTAPPGAGAEAEQPPLLVAGGIGPDNVLAALSESGAWGVDVSSGIESSPGIKDKRLMEQLVTRVKEGR
jgi:phosphoribosylanthranilate isomerase